MSAGGSIYLSVIGQCSLVFMDSRSGHILDSSMVKSESYDTIKQSLEKIKAKFGTPLVVVSDLRPGFVRYAAMFLVKRWSTSCVTPISCEHLRTSLMKTINL